MELGVEEGLEVDVENRRDGAKIQRWSAGGLSEGAGVGWEEG